MERQTDTRFRIAALIYSMVNALIFGLGLVVVLTVPSLSADAAIWVPLVVVSSLALAVPVAWWLAPRLRARYGRRATGERVNAAYH